MYTEIQKKLQEEWNFHKKSKRIDILFQSGSLPFNAEHFLEHAVPVLVISNQYKKRYYFVFSYNDKLYPIYISPAITNLNYLPVYDKQMEKKMYQTLIHPNSSESIMSKVFLETELDFYFPSDEISHSYSEIFHSFNYTKFYNLFIDASRDHTLSIYKDKYDNTSIKITQDNGTIYAVLHDGSKFVLKHI
jgi:hypothetical protein